ncbi:MAG: RdgB/HAM1 family non-canonical purine NTP pyrophosphatase [Hyphomicrobiales bacterium]|jgi:XTP/dITP diphosphohydrolase|nr:RdgB/HAM1 family non-canonical purine NTP pyrophosphatase [Hyphomicrobiales bacterium]|tara:strand:- start:2301 stop:2933 length:633 start_codon:yes stop_codon:yes gene_type:complete
MINFNEKKLLIASHNEGKISEFKELLDFFKIKIISSKDLGLPEPVEDGKSFEENALIKAKSAAELSKIVSLSDDSGIEVDSLDGKPGIYSARWAGPKKDFAFAMSKINRMLEEMSAFSDNERRARFICALCLYYPNGNHEYFIGKIEGKIVWPPRGRHGFGYDAMFLPDGMDKTFGELTSNEKHSWSIDKVGLSHRAKAFSKLAKYLPNE